MPIFGFPDLFREELGLFFEFIRLVSEIIVLFDDSIKFGVDGKMARSHLIMQILIIVFHFNES